MMAIENPSTFSNRKRNELFEFKQAQGKKITALDNVRPFVSIPLGILAFIISAGLIGQASFGGSEILALVGGIVIGRLVSYFISKSFKSAIAGIGDSISTKESEIETAIAANLAEWRSSEDRALKARISADEGDADLRMSRSKLVHEIAKCIFPKFKECVESGMSGAYLNVNARLELRVFRDRIQFGDANDAKSFKNFVFKEEGIRDELTPIYRKALCKALVSDLRVLLLEAFPVDPKRKIVQVGLEGSVKLVNGSGYRYGYTSTAPEYDNNSHAEAIILYQATENKATRRF